MSINLIGPDGQPYHIESDDPTALEKARALGYRTPDEAPVTGINAENYGSESGAVGPAARGAIKGSTFGLVNDFTTSDPERELAKLQNEEHPIAHGAGELAGAVLSPVNKVGALVEGPRAATALGRMGQKALGGASVGALFGAGSTLGDAALGDTPLTAEKLVASAGLGALLGGAGGGFAGALEEGVGTVASKLRSGSASKVLDDFANNAAVKSTRATQAAIKRVGENRLPEVGQLLRERGHLAMSPEAIADSVTADAAKVGATKGAFLDAADAAAVKPSFGEALQALDDFAAARSPLEREAVAPTFTKARAALEDIATDPKAGTWRAFDKWKQDLQAMAKFSRGASEDDLALGLRRQLAGVAREELDRQLVPALGKDGAAFLESKRTYGLLKDAQRLAESGAGRAGGFGLKDLVAGELVGGHLGGIPAAIGAKFMREMGPSVVAKLADAIAKTPALSATAASFANAAPALVQRLGPYGAAITEAFARGPAYGLAMHMAMAQTDPHYAATAQLAGLTPEGPEEHEAALSRAGGLASMAATTQGVDASIDRHIEHVIKGERAPSSPSKALDRQDFGAKRMRRDMADAHDKRTEEIRALAGDPNALLDRLSANLQQVGPVAPGVSAALTAQAHAAVQYLAKAAERPLKPGPLAQDWVPTEAERHEFTQKLEAVQDPMSVLKHAAAGTLTQNQLDALRAVYPGLAKAIADKALMRVMATKPSSVPYRSRLMLSLLTGVDLDGTTSQTAIASNQLANRSKTKSEENAAPKSGSRSEMTLAQRTALPSQRRELESE